MKMSRITLSLVKPRNSNIVKKNHNIKTTQKIIARKYVSHWTSTPIQVWIYISARRIIYGNMVLTFTSIDLGRKTLNQVKQNNKAN